MGTSGTLSDRLPRCAVRDRDTSLHDMRVAWLILHTRSQMRLAHHSNDHRSMYRTCSSVLVLWSSYRPCSEGRPLAGTHPSQRPFPPREEPFGKSSDISLHSTYMKSTDTSTGRPVIEAQYCVCQRRHLILIIFWRSVSNAFSDFFTLSSRTRLMYLTVFPSPGFSSDSSCISMDERCSAPVYLIKSSYKTTWEAPRRHDVFPACFCTEVGTWHVGDGDRAHRQRIIAAFRLRSSVSYS